MRIAALSDLHLGYRGAGRTENGRSIRERDVERAWKRAVQGIVDRDVDLVLIAGDTFDTVVPSTAAKAAFLEGLARLATRFCPVVIVGGNHETARTHGVLSPNALGELVSANVILLNAPGAHQTGSTRGGESYDVQGFGYSCLGREGVLTPEPLGGYDVNILLIHAAVRSSARPGWPNPYYGGPGAFDVARAEGFDIVACGDYHEFSVLCGAQSTMPGGFMSSSPDLVLPPWHSYPHRFTGGPVAFYPGSLERVSSNIWSEAAPKGWVLVDTEARTLEFVEVETRGMFDCSVDCGGPAYGLNDLFRELLGMERTAEALVRAHVEPLPRALRDTIDHGLVRQLHQRCVHFRLDVEWVGDDAQGEVRTEQRGLSLEDLVEQYAEGEDPAVAARMRVFLGLGEPVLEEVGA
jgi:DNA repair exonuclease SbcCD nuclease subunit